MRDAILFDFNFPVNTSVSPCLRVRQDLYDDRQEPVQSVKPINL